MGDEPGFVRRSRWCWHGPWRIVDGKRAECFVCGSLFPYEVPAALAGEGTGVCKHRIIIAYFFMTAGMSRGTCRKCHERFPLDGFADHIRLLEAVEVHREPKQGRASHSELSLLSGFPVFTLAMVVCISLLGMLFPSVTGGFLAMITVLFAGCLLVAWMINSWLRFCRGK
jgi:hypothetical protein